MARLFSTRRVPAPWLKLERKADGRIKVEGSAEGLLGHQIRLNGRERPGGVYVEWNWNGRVLNLRNDRAGMGQMLYAVLRRGEGIVLSPHVNQLLELGADATPDDEALSVLLRLGFHLGVDTPYRSIRALPANAQLTWTPGEAMLAAQSFGEEQLEISRDQAVDRYVELFRQSIERRPPSPEGTVVPLTGGNDSRHIVFELSRRGLPPDLCVTVRRYARVTDDDAAIAAAVAARLGIAHERIDLPGSLVREDFRKYARSGPMSDEGGWASVMWNRIQEYACAYDGIGGDVLGLERLGSQAYDDGFHALIQQQRWGDVAARILNHYAASEAAMAPLLAAASFKDCGRDRVLQRIEAELEKVADSPHPLAMFLLGSRTRREIAMMPWLLCNQLSPFYAPYLDEDLFDFLVALPAKLFTRGGFHRAVISRGYPEWSDLPYLVKPSGGYAAPVSKREAIQSMVELNYYAARRLPRLLHVTGRWALNRLITRAGAATAPRRVVQHWLMLEQLLRHGKYI